MLGAGSSPLTVMEHRLAVRTFYYKLASKLHPDRVEGHTDKHRDLWNKLQAAYQAEDLKRLREVEIQYVFSFDREKGNLSLDDLQRLHEIQKSALAGLRSDLRLARKNVEFGFSAMTAQQRKVLAREISADFAAKRAHLEDAIRGLKEELRFARFLFARRPARPAGKKIAGGIARF